MRGGHCVRALARWPVSPPIPLLRLCPFASLRSKRDRANAQRREARGGHCVRALARWPVSPPIPLRLCAFARLRLCVKKETVRRREARGARREADIAGHGMASHTMRGIAWRCVAMRERCGAMWGVAGTHEGCPYKRSAMTANAGRRMAAQPNAGIEHQCGALPPQRANVPTCQRANAKGDARMRATRGVAGTH